MFLDIFSFCWSGLVVTLVLSIDLFGFRISLCGLPQDHPAGTTSDKATSVLILEL